MAKKKINEVNIAGFVNRFLDDIQQKTQDRFIRKAKEKGLPPIVTTKLTVIEKEIRELEKILKDL